MLTGGVQPAWGWPERQRPHGGRQHASGHWAGTASAQASRRTTRSEFPFQRPVQGEHRSFVERGALRADGMRRLFGVACGFCPSGRGRDNDTRPHIGALKKPASKHKQECPRNIGDHQIGPFRLGRITKFTWRNSASITIIASRRSRSS